ncbi:UDP-N-acetylmuramoyl-L-alanyl-D-glutamate--2,6-diaminopimelate ligase [Zymobacter sp. IVIA_12111.31 C1]|uniref:UDP-N-acetylmuramoyl-L-alanyl-D-glutamate--2, 6-diaminopimelate ligase n=1 Tax=Zymobacter sp. IVIA_12111.31 C1 TaxID=3394854 RepID=UPI0039C3F993
MAQSVLYPRPDREGLRSFISRTWPRTSLGALDALAADAGVTQDSRQAAPGMLFIAAIGAAGDGRAYIEHALAQGAVAVLAEAPFETDDPRVMVVDDLNAHLPALIAALYPQSQQGCHIAVTGTNGKSSVTHYIVELLNALGERAALIGTLGMGEPGHLVASGFTTPHMLTVAQQAARWHADGIRYVVLEASSHALDQGRLDSIPLHAGVFTNLTRDHLDYHGSMLGYAAAKARLFRRPELRSAIVNAHDEHVRLMLAGCQCPVTRVDAYGGDADFSATGWQPTHTGQHVELATPTGVHSIDLPLLGRFNLDNVLLAVATLYAQGFDLARLLTAVASLHPVHGRMHIITEPGMPVVVVDYAHTPDALDNALTALHQHVPGRLWAIVGCGGDRDNGKRPQMAAIAERQADHVVLTDDNPRTEDPEQIRQQMRVGLQHPDAAWNIGDRRQAITTVVKAAAAADVILIAGKGHEDYQDIQGVKHPFDDALVAAEALAARAEEGRA